MKGERRRGENAVGEKKKRGEKVGWRYSLGTIAKASLGWANGEAIDEKKDRERSGVPRGVRWRVYASIDNL